MHCNSAPALARLLVLFLTVIYATPAAGQAGSGSIIGTVRDAQGGVLPGVTLTLRNQETGVTRTTVSEPDGAFDFRHSSPIGSQFLPSCPASQPSRFVMST